MIDDKEDTFSATILQTRENMIMLKRSVLNTLLAFFLMLPASMSMAGHSDAHMLAIIDSDGYVAEDDIKVVRFGSLLRQLDDSFVEDQLKIGNMTVYFRKHLRGEGVDESLLNIMESMNQMLPEKIANQKYELYVSIYTSLRSKGQTHIQATSNLKLAINSLLSGH